MLALFVCVAICLLAGLLSGHFTVDGVRTWYPSLRKPTWNPPDWVFAPVWTALYILMGIACFRVWQHHNLQDVRPALSLFGLQLGLNVLWSAVFFRWRRPDAASIESLFLWFSLVLTVVAFARVDWIAAVLMLPYLAWVSFSSMLNVKISQLNR
jgi:translocator protein